MQGEYQNEDDRNILDVLAELKRHAFTLIGLADREKFHTGMLAFTINQLGASNQSVVSLQINFIEALWDAKQNQGFLESDPCSAEAEKGSVDLLINQNEAVVFWAEVKFKTVLAGHQMSTYAKKHGEEQGALFSIFDGAENTEGFHHSNFPRQVSSFFQSADATVWLQSKDDNDEKSLIRLWVNYLELIAKATKYFENRGLQKISDSGVVQSEIIKGLNSIKLKGIFEHYRISKFRHRLAPKLPENIKLDQFNSHGNSAINIQVLPAAEGSMYPVGLQWQAGSLKLFVEGNSKIDPVADKRLIELYNGYSDERNFKHDNRRVTKGLFRSITIESWKIMDEVDTDKENTLLSWIQYLSRSNEEIGRK